MTRILRKPAIAAAGKRMKRQHAGMNGHPGAANGVGALDTGAGVQHLARPRPAAVCCYE
ncbi:MAG: hypothetical protein WAQ05_16575 [Rubrivivax sp.]